MLYSRFLFVTNREKGDEKSVFSMIVDQEKQFNFEVETNFNYIHLKNVELQLERSAD